MMPESEYLSVCNAVEVVVQAETAALVTTRRAEVELRPHDVGSAEVRPTNPAASAVGVYTQSDNEISLWPEAPGTDRAPTVDIWERDSDVVLSQLREYLRAIFAGRIELTLARGSSAGRCRFWLSDGTRQTHYYNVMLGFLVGRGPGWDTFRPEPY
jgi:hypothetical protein